MTCRRLQFDQRNAGNVLVLVLWVVIFLSACAVTLGEQAQLGMALIQHNIRRDKAYASAWAGIISVLDKLRDDPLTLKKADPVGSMSFYHDEIAGGRFDVLYRQDGKIYDGIQGEENKIDLNALTVQTVPVLVQLLQLLGFDEERSRIAAASIVDWQDDDQDPTDHGYGAEDDHYGRLVKPYRCKNAPFDSLEELMLVRGISEDLYQKIKDYVTVYPRTKGRLSINVQAAPAVVIQALARSFAGGPDRLTIDDADELTRKIVDYRRGDDGKEQTDDDRALEAALMGLTASQKILFLRMLPFKVDRPNYFTIRSRGAYKTTVVKLEAVIRRQDLSILAWRMTDD